MNMRFSKHFLRQIYMAGLFLLAGPGSVFCQQNNFEHNWQAIVKFAPTVLLEPEGGYQVGFEAPLGKRWGWQNELAYLCYYWDIEGSFDNFNQVENFEFSGYAFKSELRYYFFDSDHLEGLYIAPQAQYKYIFRAGTIQQGFDPWGQPLEPTDFTHYKEVAKVNIKGGYQVISNNGFAFDMYCGGGARMAWVHSKPSGYENIYFVNEEIPLNVMLGFRLGWAF